ncbi:hypothetical protein K32_46870 [Kaistia sp. 32K]|nr:hypothetical protein K32_46870 [Kaistia sp. 32K]
MTRLSRPTTLSFEDRLAVATELAIRMAEAGLIRPDRFQVAPHDIATYGAITKDGEELGRDLARYEAWRAGEAVCAALDDYGRMLAERLDALQVRWAIDNDIRPRFQIGDRVVWPKVAGEDNVGTVTGIEPGARYSILHDRAAASGSTLRHLVDFEACRAEGEPAPPRRVLTLPRKIGAALSAWLSIEAMDFAMRTSIMLP